MKNKIIIKLGLLFLFVALVFNPINATDYDGYTVNVNGFNFNMIDGYEQSYDTIIDEDGTDIYGDQVHLYLVDFNGDDGEITISTMTRYSEPFTQGDALSAGTNSQNMISTVQNISGITGKLVEDKSSGDSKYSFWYVQDGTKIVIDADSVEKIEFCLNNTSY